MSYDADVDALIVGAGPDGKIWLTAIDSDEAATAPTTPSRPSTRPRRCSLATKATLAARAA